MSSWQEFADAAPELAARARLLLDGHKHKTMATLRADGSPRISGTEIEFHGAEVTVGMMPDSMKLRDVLRDPRVAIHGPSIGATTDDEAQTQPRWAGDAKFAGTLEPIAKPAEPAPDGSFFRVNLAEVVLTYLNDARDELVIESWTPVHGVRRISRK